ncbi:MAG: 1-deoxy-D-xylulose-5-phosphate reductoisomerase [Spirochaetia bacterium]
MKRIIVLGSTGSIGASTLAVVRAMPGSFRVGGLACRRRADRLAAQSAEFLPESVAIVDAACRDALSAAVPIGTHLYTGSDAVLRMIQEVPADIVVNGISGAAGLLPTMAALRAGSSLALANKESMVMAGRQVLAEAAVRGCRVLPVDSEHAALFSILGRQDPSEVEELILTASGGAFRSLSLDELSRVRFADALRHPTWKMGAKITVDSATMANKGLEVIEAQRLFGIAPPRIKVLIHPESLVHSLVRTVDGTLHAEISTPDMRIPIQNALTYPARTATPVEWLDLAQRSLTFQAVDARKYRMLDLAYSAATSASAAHPIVYNAANEVAVASFMDDAITFANIPVIVEEALSRDWSVLCDTIEGVLAVDAEARRFARECMKEFAA